MNIPEGYKIRRDMWGNPEGFYKPQSDDEFRQFVPGTKTWGLNVTASSVDGLQDNVTESYGERVARCVDKTVDIGLTVLFSSLFIAFVAFFAWLGLHGLRR